MTSLSEAYEGGKGGTDLRRLYAGVGLFLVGTLALVTAIVITTTSVYVGGETTMTDARHVGGLLGGLGLPAMFLGVFAVLPSSRRTKAAAVIGAAIAVLGVGLYWHAYPCQWVGSNCGAGLMDLTLPTVGTYFLGAVTALWCLFIGVANFKTRNDPGGTARVNVTTKGETKVVEIERNRGIGSLGFLGGTPDGDVETQTAGAGTATTSATDGGASTRDISSPLDTPKASVQQSAPSSGSNPQSEPGVLNSTDPTKSDHYCGNCTHFEYVRTDEGIQPYCGLDGELMDDMDACEEWTPRQ
jgi:hypothetical protein